MYQILLSLIYLQVSRHKMEFYHEVSSLYMYTTNVNYVIKLINYNIFIKLLQITCTL